MSDGIRNLDLKVLEQVNGGLGGFGDSEGSGGTGGFDGSGEFGETGSFITFLYYPARILCPFYKSVSHACLLLLNGAIRRC